MRQAIQKFLGFKYFLPALLFVFFLLGADLPSGISANPIPLPNADDTALPGVLPAGPAVIGSAPEVQPLANALSAITNVIRGLLGVVAIAWIIYSAILIISGGSNEEQVSQGKRGVTYGALGLVFALMIDTLILDVFYGGGSFEAGETLDNSINARSGIDAGTLLILDAISWFQGIVVIGAVAYLIFSGFKMITALGDSEEISKQKTVFLWIGVGIVVMLLNEVFVTEVLYKWALSGEEVSYSPDSTKGITEITGVIRYFLGFLAVIAFVVFIYGGAQMITAFGNEEKVESGKKALIGAAIGIVVILMSYVVVSTLIGGTVK